MRLRSGFLMAVVSVTTTTVMAACGLVIDPDVLIAGVTEDGTTSSSGGSSGASGSSGDANNGGNDAGFDGDAALVPDCTPTPEKCNDGVDNNCNRLADCADPDCNVTFACVELPPDGWTQVILAETSRPACPPGYAQSTDVKVLAGSGNYTCTCDCSGSCNGGITLTKGADNTCAGVPAGATDPYPATTNDVCTAVGGNYDMSAFGKLTTPTPSACAQKNVTTKPASLTDGRTCAPTAGPGAGCTGSLGCFPRAPGFLSCIAKPTTEPTCPTGFPKLRRVGTLTTSDDRTCAGCTCNAGTCDSELDFWTVPNCPGTAMSKLTTSAHTTCAAATIASNIKGYKTKTTFGCTEATPSMQQGIINFQNEQTICCK